MVIANLQAEVKARSRMGATLKALSHACPGKSVRAAAGVAALERQKKSCKLEQYGQVIRIFLFLSRSSHALHTPLSFVSLRVTMKHPTLLLL